MVAMVQRPRLYRPLDIVIKIHEITRIGMLVKKINVHSFFN